MKAFRIKDNRNFMKMLLSEDCFDEWILKEATVIKGASLVLDGMGEGNEASTYKSFRKVLFEFIRGKETPSYMKFVFLYNEPAEGVQSRSLNVIFRDGVITVTTGLALSGFSLDRTLEMEWDAKAESFLTTLGVEIEYL